MDKSVYVAYFTAAAGQSIASVVFGGGTIGAGGGRATTTFATRFPARHIRASVLPQLPQ
jgi:hypothetical protein